VTNHDREQRSSVENSSDPAQYRRGPDTPAPPADAGLSDSKVVEASRLALARQRASKTWTVSRDGNGGDGGGAAPATTPEALIRQAAEPLPAPDDPDFAAFADRIVERRRPRVVLLGEASHGTSEFYRARAAITRRLIERHGFGIVAVEADWPDAAAIDRYVRHRAAAAASSPARRPFERFPTWMWRNTDFAGFIEWLREHNRGLADPARQASFHGLDLYSLNASIHAVLDYLDKVDPAAARDARARYGCLSPWALNPERYGRAAPRAAEPPCEREVAAMLRDLLAHRSDYARQDGESFCDAAQNARLVAAAERYYRIMYRGGRESWNLRDTHMFETLDRLLQARGADARAVVWAHNSHIGNAAATEPGWRGGELNIGQLCRERFGAAAVMIGFGTDRGTVAAATDWGGEMEVKQIRPALPGSYEQLCRDAGAAPSFLLDFDDGRNQDLVHELQEWPRLERAIGVVYRPETERWSHYFEANLPSQFDAFIWFDQTRAVTPLPSEDRSTGLPDTYPFGV